MKRIRIVLLAICLTFLNSCANMTAQDWQDLSDGLNQLNCGLYGVGCGTTSRSSASSVTSGFTKVCYYNGPGGQSARTVSSTSICPLTHTPRLSGFTKVCTYNTIGGQKAITVGSTTICPLVYP